MRDARRLALVAFGLTMPLAAHAQGIVVLRAGSGGRVLPAAPAVVAVPVTLDMSNAGSLNVASISATVHWTLPALTLDSIKAGAFGSLTSNLSGASSGSAAFSVFNATGTTASVTVATLYFTSHAGASTITLEPTGAGNEAGQSVLGSVRVQSLESCVGPTTLWGDVNADGAVNIVDAQQVARNTVGLSVLNPAELAANGDVNGDGQVTIIDAQQIARFSVGLSASPRVNTANARGVVVTSLAVRAFIQADFGAEWYGVPRNPLALGTGVQGQLEMLAKDASNTDVTACAALTYMSSSASASVSPTGLVTGGTPGSATITISAGPSAQAQLGVFSNSGVTITVSSNISGTTQTGGGLYAGGSSVTVTTTVPTGVTFTGWTENGTVVSTSPSYSFTATSSRALVATFQTPPAPVLTITSPLPLDATTALVFYNASCTNCTQLTVGTGPFGTYQASGTTSVSGTFNLHGSDGVVLNFVFTATGYGGTTTASRQVSVVESSYISEIGWVNGRVLDADTSRAVYAGFSNVTTAGGLGFIRTHADIATFVDASQYKLHEAFVTPLGAIYTYDDGFSIRPYYVGDYGSGASLHLIRSEYNFQVNGNYAVFGGGTSIPGPLFRRDIGTTADIVVAPLGTPSVGPNGVIAYNDGAPSLYVYRNGVTQKIDSAFGGFRAAYPVTDGTNVLYQYFDAADRSNAVASLKYFNGSTYTILGKAYNNVNMLAGTDYTVTNGWVAYTLPDGCQCLNGPFGVKQLYERSPAGVTTRITTVRSHAAIESASEDGRVVFTAGGRRYLYTPGGLAVDIGAALGKVVYRKGTFLQIIGQTVWRLTP